MKKHSLRCNYDEKEAVKYEDLEALGFKKTCLATLNRAYRDLYARSAKERESAITWIMDDLESDDTYLTFHHVCNMLELDIDYIRDFITKKNVYISKSIQGWSHLNRTSLFARNYRSIEGNNVRKKTGVL